MCYGFKKAYGGHGNLIKTIMMRSSQLLNEDCIAALTKLQLSQIRVIVDFMEACLALHGDVKDFVFAAVQSMQKGTTLSLLLDFQVHKK